SFEGDVKPFRAGFRPLMADLKPFKAHIRQLGADVKSFEVGPGYFRSFQAASCRVSVYFWYCFRLLPLGCFRLCFKLLLAVFQVFFQAASNRVLGCLRYGFVGRSKSSSAWARLQDLPLFVSSLGRRFLDGLRRSLSLVGPCHGPSFEEGKLEDEDESSMSSIMEHREAHTASKRATADDDFISSMPDNVMSNIMDRLPLQNAVRTSVMSRSWRFKWTLLTQLVLDEYFFKFILASRKKFDRTDISRLLLHLKGAIKRSKDFTLKSAPYQFLKLPTHLYSCQELEHLKLQYYFFRPSPSFCGFPSLLSLKLNAVKFQGYQCGELIAQCPLLEVLRITNHEVGCEVKLDEIAKLENLKKLSLSLLDKSTMIMDPSIFEQMCLNLPKLEGLSLDFGNCKLLDKRVPTAFSYLKTLKLYQMDFSSSVMVSCVFGMIFGSSNLQTLKITATYKNAVQPTAICSSEVDYNTIGKTQLRNVVLTSIWGSVYDLCLIKSLLAGSPLLKKMVICARPSEMFGGEREFTTKLLKLHRASPIAGIDITWL
ncbi:putative F-box-like domain superfamily protein, partial [Tanacetum coccineum]